MNREDAFDKPSVPIMGQDDRGLLDEELAEFEKTIEEASEPERDLVRHYIKEAARILLLKPEEEKCYLMQYQSDNEAERNEAYAVLVQHNLRLVIKIAFDFKNYWMSNMLDLIQEGNIGLMHAIKKFDPYRGIKLSYYASFWIKAYILKFIMDNWKLAKIATTTAQRKLFYNLKREKEKLRAKGYDPDDKLVAETLGVKKNEVAEMDQRLSNRDFSLNTPLKDGSANDHVDFLPDNNPTQEDVLTRNEMIEDIREKIQAFLEKANLNDREADILNLRILADSSTKITVSRLGKKHGVSGSRISAIEKRLKEKLRAFFPNAEPNKVEKEVIFDLQEIDPDKIRKVLNFSRAFPITEGFIAAFMRSSLSSSKMKKTFFLIFGSSDISRQFLAERLGIGVATLSSRKHCILKELKSFNWRKYLN